MIIMILILVYLSMIVAPGGGYIRIIYINFYIMYITYNIIEYNCINIIKYKYY